jgi:gliding motility-associated-like protein
VTYEIIDCQGNIVYTDGPNPALGGGVWSGTGVNPTPPNYNFSWTPTGGLSNPNISDPLVTVSNNMTYVVSVYETGHLLCASTDTVQVIIDPAAYAGEDSVNTLCFNDPSFNMFSFLGGTPAVTGSWFDASGVPVSNMFDPSVQSSGQYMYVVSSGGICPNDTAVIDVTVLPPGAPGCGCNLNPSSVVTDISCFGVCDGEIDITANSTEYSLDGGITFQSSGLFSGMCAGSYDVLIADSAFGPACVTTVSVVVTEPTLLTLDLTAIDAICFNACDGSMNAIVAGGTPPYVYAYSNGVGTPSNTNLCAGTYNLMVTDNNGCTQDTMNVEILQNPEVTIDLLTATDETCFELCDGTIEVSGQNISEFSIDNGVNFSATGSYVNLCTGIYSLVVQDADGCRAYGNIAVSGPPPVLAGFTFSPEETNVLQTNFSFINTSQNAFTYQWFLADQMFSSEVNPEYSLPDQAGTYTVCLVASNLNGCLDTVCQEIIIDDILVVYVPNAFTPDGDNINERVVPVMQGYKTEGYRFQIFDRWGEMIFSSTEPGAGWDGTFKGFSAKTDVYVWKLQVVSVADNSTHSYTGHVTLVK